VKRSARVALGTRVAIDALAVFRLTKLLQNDTIPPLPALRQAYMRRYGATPWGELVDCPWCLSMWLGGLALLADRVSPRVWGLVSRVLAASAVTGLLSLVAAELDREPVTLTQVVTDEEG
jgi:hypothetical protein